MELNDLISTKAAGRILGRSVLTVQKMVHRGDLPQPIRVHARCWRHQRRDIEAAATAKLRAKRDQQQVGGVIHER